jgi:hypothetical protein
MSNMVLESLTLNSSTFPCAVDGDSYTGCRRTSRGLNFKFSSPNNEDFDKATLTEVLDGRKARFWMDRWHERTQFKDRLRI